MGQTPSTMSPRKNKPPIVDVKPLEGRGVVFAGAFSFHTHSELGDLVRALGGQAFPNIRPANRVHYLVCTQSEYDRSAAKVVDAMCSREKVDIVNLGFLLACETEKKEPNPDSFRLRRTPPSEVIKTDAGPTGESDVASRKRKADEVEVPSRKKVKAVTARRKVSRKPAINVPVDRWCHLKDQGYAVYIDDASTIYDAVLNHTSVGNNRNKFYRIQVSNADCTAADVIRRSPRLRPISN
jgi:hypothetical protein